MFTFIHLRNIFPKIKKEEKEKTYFLRKEKCYMESFNWMGAPKVFPI